jgi:hypothetical protein
MQLYFKLKLSNHPAASINRARAQIVIARKIIACEWQKIWDSMSLRRLSIRAYTHKSGLVSDARSMSAYPRNGRESGYAVRSECLSGHARPNNFNLREMPKAAAAVCARWRTSRPSLESIGGRMELLSGDDSGYRLQLWAVRNGEGIL